MRMMGSKMKSGVERLKNMELMEMMETCGNLLELPGDFGNPVRVRLFSPGNHLLALPRPGPRP